MNVGSHQVTHFGHALVLSGVGLSSDTTTVSLVHRDFDLSVFLHSLLVHSPPVFCQAVAVAAAFYSVYRGHLAFVGPRQLSQCLYSGVIGSAPAVQHAPANSVVFCMVFVRVYF